MGKEFDCSRDSSLFCDLEKRNGVLTLVGPVEIGGLCECECEMEEFKNKEGNKA